MNRFSRPGGTPLVTEISRRGVGVCSLRIDPYLDGPPVGRVRNLDVLAACRGRRFVEGAIALARGPFDRLRLRGEEAGPASLYESRGFRPCGDVTNCTHMLECPGPTGEG